MSLDHAESRECLALMKWAGGHGVALHAGQRTWEANFGTESELLAAVRELLP